MGINWPIFGLYTTDFEAIRRDWQDFFHWKLGTFCEKNDNENRFIKHEAHFTSTVTSISLPRKFFVDIGQKFSSENTLKANWFLKMYKVDEILWNSAKARNSSVNSVKNEFDLKNSPHLYEKAFIRKFLLTEICLKV